MKTAALVFTLIVLSSAFTLSVAGTAAGCTRADFENVIESTAQTIYIQSDGSIVPASAPIRRDGDAYTITSDIFSPIAVDKANIVIDGAGFTLQGPYNGTLMDLWIIGEGSAEETSNDTQTPWTVGIDLRADNSTVMNLNVKNFTIGIWLWTANNTVTGNALTENLLGILLSGTNNFVAKNFLSNNRDGIFFGANPSGTIPTNITLSSNGFVNNHRQLSGCVCAEFNKTEATHTWDNGKEGNFWSDYNGVDANSDGIGDSPYIVDILNQDRYPLMQNTALAPTVVGKAPVELLVVAAVLSAIAVAAYFGRRKKPKQT